jgi:type II secretory pathway pseudopilin PulG
MQVRTGNVLMTSERETVPDTFIIQPPTSSRKSIMLKHQTSAIQSLLHRRGQMSTTAIVFLVLGIIFVIMVVVVAIGAALFLPAVSQARQAARSTQSKNNLKQIGLAMHNYRDVYNQFPPGGIYTSKQEPYNAWMTSLLPYIEQASLYSMIDSNQPWTSPSNQQAFKVVIPNYMNPNIGPENATVGGLGAAHYAGNSQLLLNNGSVIFEEITDGSSNTIMAGEVGTNFMAWGDPENRRDPANGFGTAPNQFGVAAPGIGGVQMCLADGSVRFVSENIDPAVLKALATPAGGEMIGEF